MPWSPNAAGSGLPLTPWSRRVSPTVYVAPRAVQPSRAAPADEPQNPVAQDAPIYALAAALQAVPLVLQTKESHYVFFLGLATATVYLSSRAPSLAPPEAEPLTMKQAALAPVLASISLFSLYALIKYLSIDPSLGYRLLTSAFAGGASSLVLYEAADALSDEDDRAVIGGVLAFILVALYLGSDALQLSLEAKTGIANFLGWSLAYSRRGRCRCGALGWARRCWAVFFCMISSSSSAAMCVMTVATPSIDATTSVLHKNRRAQPAGLHSKSDAASKVLDGVVDRSFT